MSTWRSATAALTATLLGRRDEGMLVTGAVTFILAKGKLVTVRQIRPRAFDIGQGRSSARIAPDSGEVVGWIDLSALYPRAGRPTDNVLNGIAYDAATERLFVTGKYWPQLFELEIH